MLSIKKQIILKSKYDIINSRGELIMVYIGVDIGGTKCAVVTGDEKSNILNKVSFKTTDFKNTFERIVKEIEDAPKGVAIGISCGGPLNSETGVIMSPPNLPGWDNVEIVKILKDKFKIPVFLQNDADACALAEWKCGAGKGAKNMAFLTFGTGLGAGLILNGELYNGTNGNAGEIGHIRLSEDGPVGFGKAGSFEGWCSGGGIGRFGEMYAQSKEVSYRDEEGNITAKSIAQAAEKGDEDALYIYANCGEMLGKGLAILIDTLNLEKIVIGSVFERSGHLMRESMDKVLEKECIGISREVCEVVPAKLGDYIGDIAALCVAINGSKSDSLADRYPALSVCMEDIENAKELIIDTYKKGGKVLVCGNGGSAADCEHIVGELMKGFLSKRTVNDERIHEELRNNLQGALPAISLPSQSAILSAFANDVEPDMVYAQLVYGYANENDLLIGLTTSGNSKNVVYAAQVAKAKGAKVLGLTGANESKLSKIADITIKAPETETYKIQEYHLPIYHYLCAEVEKYFFEE